MQATGNPLESYFNLMFSNSIKHSRHVWSTHTINYNCTWYSLNTFFHSYLKLNKEWWKSNWWKCDIYLCAVLNSC